MKPISLVIIDDEPHVVSALTRVLRLGLAARSPTIEAFTDPARALKRLSERPFDLVICDYRMPEVDGLTVLRRLASTHPDAVRLLLTGTPDMQVVIDAVNQASVARVLLKPWDNYQLLDTIRSCLKRRDDLLEERRLADIARSSGALLSAQEMEMRRLEQKWPGITEVNWTADGWVQLGDTGLGPMDTQPHNGP